MVVACIGVRFQLGYRLGLKIDEIPTTFTPFGDLRALKPTRRRSALASWSRFCFYDWGMFLALFLGLQQKVN
jgi:hypothetical protein